MKSKKEHINPKGLFKNPAFSQIVTTQGSGITIYIGGQNARRGFEVSQKFLGKIPNQPIISVLFISGFVNPEYLVEIDAIAFVSID